MSSPTARSRRARTSGPPGIRGRPTGSAAAPAEGTERRSPPDLAAGTLGTDTAGSIRIPSCYCGVTGLRPSTGRVSNRGVVPVAQLRHRRADRPDGRGLRAPPCGDRGPRSRRPGHLDAPAPPYAELLGEGVRGLRVGVVTSLVEGADPRVAAAVEAALAELRVARRRARPRRACHCWSRRERSSRRCSSRRPRRRTWSGCARGSPTTATTYARACWSASSSARRPRQRGSARARRPATGLRRIVRAGRPPRRADDARAAAANRLGDRRARRARDALPARAHPLQLTLEPRRRAGRQRAVRLRRGLPVGLALVGPPLRRGDHSRRRPRLSAGHRLARAPSGAREEPRAGNERLAGEQALDAAHAPVARRRSASTAGTPPHTRRLGPPPDRLEARAELGRVRGPDGFLGRPARPARPPARPARPWRCPRPRRRTPRRGRA